jgi:hypothetical protein
MATSKVFTGPRAIVRVNNQIVGLFESVTYTVNLGNEAIHILGRFSPAEIAITSYEAVSATCSGFRVIDQGVHVLPAFPKQQDLLNLDEITLTIVDRQTGQNKMILSGCKPTSYNTGDNAKAVSKVSITYIGVKVEDENGSQQEINAADLP